VYIVLYGTVPNGTIAGGLKLSKMKEAHEILELIRRISAATKRRMIHSASGMGFSVTQFLVMHELTHTDKICMQELKEKCALPKSTLSRVVSQLVKRGMVKRARPENNRRVVILSVTQAYVKGKEKLKQAVAEEMSGRLTPVKTAAIIKTLEELYEMMNIEN
jgi:DNA-binding MarR family transcriptional regulator